MPSGSGPALRSNRCRPEAGATSLSVIMPLINIREVVRFVKFAGVGGLNTAIAYGIYALLIYLGNGYIVASTVSFVLGLIISFKTHRRLVFGRHGPQLLSFSLYVGSWLILYAINVGSLALLIRAGVNDYLAAAVLIPPMAVISFVVLRFFVFRDRKSGEPK